MLQVAEERQLRAEAIAGDVQHLYKTVTVSDSEVDERINELLR